VSDLAGQLDILLTPRGDGPGVQIRSSRPLTAARVFAGKPVATVSGQLPLLYSICGTAQAMACALACEAALGLAPAPSAQAARGLLLRAETAKEHLWRLLLDWPKALVSLGIEPHPAAPGTARDREAAMAAVLRAFLHLRTALTTAGDPFLPGSGRITALSAQLESAAAALAATATDWVFGVAPADWLAETLREADLLRWADTAGTPTAALLRALTTSGLAELGRCAVAPLPVERPVGGLDEALLRQLAGALAGSGADGFVAAPVLDGRPAETTPFSRELARGELVADLAKRYGNGLLPRLAALLAELARDSAQLATAPLGDAAAAPVGAAFAQAGGVGVGAAPAARGLLVHRVEMGAGRAPDTASVRDYRILAPTEWNFHPAGVVATALSQLGQDKAADAAMRDARARLVITAVDPCVDYQLSLC
jgi:hypothetical protein